MESNPEVMTEFASRIGLDTQQFSFHDIFGLDEEVRLGEGALVPLPAWLHTAPVFSNPGGPELVAVRHS